MKDKLISYKCYGRLVESPAPGEDLLDRAQKANTLLVFRGCDLVHLFRILSLDPFGGKPHAIAEANHGAILGAAEYKGALVGYKTHASLCLRLNIPSLSKMRRGKFEEPTPWL